MQKGGLSRPVPLGAFGFNIIILKIKKETGEISISPVSFQPSDHLENSLSQREGPLTFSSGSSKLSIMAETTVRISFVVMPPLCRR